MALFPEMEVEQHVKLLSHQLAEAVEVILDSNSSQEKRRQASQFCEEFKNTSLYLTNCGIYLYNTSTSTIVKHFGLQLIQRAVKFKWNVLDAQQKSNLMLMSLQFVEMGCGPIVEEQPYVKDGIARLTVEIMKREWPQNWPDLFQNLSNISQKGDSQLYIVLRILLRLAEEVTNTEGNLPIERRREMLSALLNLLDELFKFFIKTLQFNVNKMKELKTQSHDTDNKEVLLHKMLSESVLTTLSGYVGWVHTKYLVQDNAAVLQLLCLMLQEDEFRVIAAECLELIAGRKGKLIERKPLLILFSVDAIQIMFSSATSVVANESDEETNTFLKRVCNVLSLLGHLQLANIWGSECDDQGEPAHFSIYLEALMALHQHNSMLMTDMTNRVWLSFLKNQEISMNKTFCSFLPRLLELSKSKLSRAGNLTMDKLQSFCSESDFGTITEKQAVWRTVRANTREIIQEITGLFPTDSFLQAALWLLKQINYSSNGSQVPVTETSSEYLEWDSMNIFFHSVSIRLFNNDQSSIKELMTNRVMLENSSITIGDLGKKCIESLLQFNKEELTIMGLAISCLEALLPFLEFFRELLLPVIHKIFDAVSFVSPFKDLSSSDSGALEFRRIAGTFWIRLCLKHTKLLVEILDELTRHIQGLYARDDFNSQERALLTEGLVIISNGYKNYEKQNKYIGEILAPIRELWMTRDIESALSSSESLITFIGLDKTNEDQQCQNNRFRLQVCLRFIHAVLKRVEPPLNSQEQVDGGFKVKHEDEPLNPCSSQLLPLLSNFFHLIRVFNNIWHPDMFEKISAYYQPALEMHTAEKAALIGFHDFEDKLKEEPKKSDADAMKSFLFKLSEICGLILSDCTKLGKGFYSTPLLGEHLVNYVIETWKYLPNYRLRFPIRNFFKFYCRMCPPSQYESAVVPIVSVVLSQMIERLNKEWEKVRQREKICYSGNPEEAKDENKSEDKSKEVIEDQLVHLLTKNFMESFFAICTLPRSKTHLTESEKADQETPPEGNKQSNADDILQDLAKYLLKNPETCKVTFFTPFFALQWPDLSSFVKASKLCIPFLKQFVQCPPLGVAMDPEMFEQLFTLLLKGLQLMGHNIEVQSQLIRSAVVIYDTLRPLFPELKKILLQVPNADATVIDDYDKSLFGEQSLSEKQKKKVFKSLLGGLIGKEVGKMFQDDITILNLPALSVVRKPSPARLEDLESKDIGLIRLFEPSDVYSGST